MTGTLHILLQVCMFTVKSSNAWYRLRTAVQGVCGVQHRWLAPCMQADSNLLHHTLPSHIPHALLARTLRPQAACCSHAFASVAFSMYKAWQQPYIRSCTSDASVLFVYTHTCTNTHTITVTQLIHNSWLQCIQKAPLSFLKSYVIS